jgi:hypothetical protein
MNFVRPENTQISTHYPAAETIFVMPLGVSPVANLQKRNEWSDDVYDSISWRVYGSASAGLTNSLRTFVVKLSHGWLTIGERERRCSATTDLCFQCNEIEIVPHLYRAGPGQRGSLGSEIPLAEFIGHDCTALSSSRGTDRKGKINNCNGHTLHNHEGHRELVSYRRHERS